MIALVIIATVICVVMLLYGVIEAITTLGSDKKSWWEIICSLGILALCIYMFIDFYG